jgi:hypothetical protein
VALGKLAVGCRQEMDDATGEVYLEALCYQFPIETFEAFVKDANARGRYDFFPRLAELRQDLVDERASAAVAGLLPQDTRTPEQRQADAVETSRRLREIVGAEPPAWPKHTTSAPIHEPRRVVATEDRLAELRAQAEKLALEEGAKAQ